MTSVPTESGRPDRRSGMSKADFIEWLEQLQAEYENNGQLNEMWAIQRVIRKVMEE